MRALQRTVLIVDDDKSVVEVVAEILRDEGYAVACLADGQLGALQAEVARLEPEVVLLDGGGAAGYGQSWNSAAWLRTRGRPIAVIMFTAHQLDLAEAMVGQSERSRCAQFVGFLPKPFDLDAVVDQVAQAMRGLAVDGTTVGLRRPQV